MKYFLMLSLFVVVCSCSNNDEPTAPAGPVSFVEPGLEMDAYANTWYTFDMLNYDETKHSITLNGKTLEVRVTKIDETHSTVNIMLPSKVGAGHLELHDGTTVILGPQLNYLQRYLYLPLERRFTTYSMCGYGDNKILMWDALARNFITVRFVGFSDSGNPEYTFGMKTYPVTYTGSGVTRRYEFTGLTRSQSGEVIFYRMFAGATSDERHHRILTSSDMSTATDFSNGIATDQISTVYDLERDSKGNLFTVETSRLVVRKIYPGGVDQFAGSGTMGVADGTNIDASFRVIRGITIDPTDNIYVADSSRVRMITSAGVVTTLAGSVEHGDKDGSLSEARFGGLMGISTAPSGELYLYDGRNGKFKVISADRKTVRTLNVMDHPSLLPGKEDRNPPMYVDANGNIFYMLNEGSLYMLMPEDNAPVSVIAAFNNNSQGQVQLIQD